MARRRILIRHGDSLNRVIDWDASDGSAIDLTGYILICTIRVGEVLYTLFEGSGLSVDDSEGRITIELTPAETAAFTERYGVWRLQAEPYSGDMSTTLVEGLVFVNLGDQDDS